MSPDEIRDFCTKHINDLSYECREEVFNIIRIYVSDDDIDSSNSDGSRIYTDAISNECFQKIYKIIKSWLEN